MALALGYAAAGFVLAGFSEVLSPLFGLALAILWLRFHQRRYIAAAVGLAIGTLIVLSAPGNAVRLAALPPRMNFIPMLGSLLQYTGSFFINSMIKHGGGLILVFLVGYLCPLKVPVRRLRAAQIVAFLTLAVIVFTLCVPLYALGSLDTRHFTFAAFALCVGLFLLGGLCASSRPSSSS